MRKMRNDLRSLTHRCQPLKELNREEIEVCKKYHVSFVWGQLNLWFKQTVSDPTASLSADRRGTVSLPDIESCYGSGRKDYYKKVGA